MERLADALNREPVAERDRFFMAMLIPLGIEKRKPFKPDARRRLEPDRNGRTDRPTDMTNQDSPSQKPSRGRLVLGGVIFVGGQLVPLSVPLVASSSLPTVWKTVLSAVLLISPELFVLVAVAVLGKAGFDHLVGLFRKALGRFFEKHGPPEVVGRTRYRIGLVMFIVPLVLGWATRYMSHYISGFDTPPILFGLTGDVLLLASLFVLGGEFWDKLRGLFIHGAWIQFPGDEVR